MSRIVMTSARPSGIGRARKRLLAAVTAVAVALPALILGTAAPASAAVQVIAFEAPNNSAIALGELASRSQRKAVGISGIGPYTIRGTDSRTQQPYEFSTDFNYNPATPAWGRESDERALQSPGSYSSNAAASYAGRNNVLQLASSAGCTPNNAADITYCSTFGPDVYTQPFQAVVGQAVSFDWAALRSSDDYEIYAFLVRVDGSGYGTPADHTLLTYGRGGSQGWTTTSRDIPADGTYRFRFVNGSYDKTGGLALGSNLYVDNTVKLGLSNPIAFPGLGDRIRTDAPFPVTASAPGGPVGLSSSTGSVCTVSGTTVTLTGAMGICTVLANQAGGQDHVPAETVARSFRVLDAPTAPTNAGRPYVTGTIAEGETVTAEEGTWTDGGSPVTGTTFQWVSTVGGTSTPISGETATTCYLVASPGSQLSVVVTKTNSVGSTSASSVPLNGYTCGQPVAPAWSAQGLGSAVVGSPLSATFSASGVPAPTYSIAAGALPQGLALDGATGAVSGTPTTVGPYTFTIRATNASGDADLPVSGTVNSAPGPITGSPDAFVVGVAASGAVSSESTPAPGYLVSDGALPDGVVIDPATGAFSGTPTTAGPYDFTITAGNGIGAASTRRFSGEVAQAPGWQTQQGLRAELGVAVDVTYTADGSPAPQYSIGTGALPAGLTLDSATGRITGTPSQAGPFSFTLVATNQVGSSPLLIEGTVVEEAGPITGGPGEFVVGQTVSGTVTSNGTPAPVYTVTSGELPSGVALDPVSGVFTGTPARPSPARSPSP